MPLTRTIERLTEEVFALAEKVYTLALEKEREGPLTVNWLDLMSRDRRLDEQRVELSRQLVALQFDLENLHPSSSLAEQGGKEAALDAIRGLHRQLKNVEFGRPLDEGFTPAERPLATAARADEVPGARKMEAARTLVGKMKGSRPRPSASEIAKAVDAENPGLSHSELGGLLAGDGDVRNTKADSQRGRRARGHKY
jgi:hypothetical protein